MTSLRDMPPGSPVAAPLTTALATALDWSAIDTVLLDLDGTLLDLAYDNYIWLARVPELYAELHGLAVSEARERLAPRFRASEGTLDWYDIDFWSRQLGFDVEALHREESGRIAWLPGARGFLETLRERGKRLVLLTNSHPRLLDIKHEHSRVRDFLDAAWSSHTFRAPKEQQAFWEGVRAVEDFDPARSLFVDDSPAVLHAAVLAGIRHVRAVRRPDSARDAREHPEFIAIDGVADLL